MRDLWTTRDLPVLTAYAELDAEGRRPEEHRKKAKKFGRWVAASVNTVGLEVAAAVLTGQIPGQ